MLAVPLISLLQASWLLWVAAGIVLNASLQWKHLFPGVLQDALHYGKLKLDVRGGEQTLGLLNVPKSYAIRSLAGITFLAFEKMSFFHAICTDEARVLVLLATGAGLPRGWELTTSRNS